MRIRAETYGQAIGSALAQQLVVFLLAAVLIEWGVVLQVFAFSMAAFWAGTLMIWARRRVNPTKLDLYLIEGGSIPLCVLAYFLSAFIWSVRGVQ